MKAWNELFLYKDEVKIKFVINTDNNEHEFIGTIKELKESQFYQDWKDEDWLDYEDEINALSNDYQIYIQVDISLEEY